VASVVVVFVVQTLQQLRRPFVSHQKPVYTIRRQYHERGLKGTLSRKKPDRIYERCLDGEAEAHLIALTCSEAPAGHAGWTLRLLRDQMVELAYVEKVSHETIRTVLKKRTQTVVE